MISYFILVFQFLSLSFWIGGSAVLLLIAVPATSQALSGHPDSVDIVGSFFKRYYSFFILNAILLAVTLYLQIAFLSHGILFKLRIAMTFVSVAMLIAAYHRFSLTPAIERMRAQGSPPAAQEKIGGMKVQSLHRRSLILFSVNLFLGVAVVITLLLPFH